MGESAKAITLWEVLSEVPHRRSRLGSGVILRLGSTPLLLCVVVRYVAREVLAALRNAATTLLRWLGFANISKGINSLIDERANIVHLIRFGEKG